MTPDYVTTGIVSDRADHVEIKDGDLILSHRSLSAAWRPERLKKCSLHHLYTGLRGHTTPDRWRWRDCGWSSQAASPLCTDTRRAAGLQMNPNKMRSCRILSPSFAVLRRLPDPGCRGFICYFSIT